MKELTKGILFRVTRIFTVGVEENLISLEELDSISCILLRLHMGFKAKSDDCPAALPDSARVMQERAEIALILLQQIQLELPASA